MRRIFILGEHGQLGCALTRAYVKTENIVAGADRATLDITDRAAVAAAIAAFRPDIVINAAAYTQVDKAEDDADQAFAVNRDGARHAAAAARAAEARLIHISTDYVFDGRKGIAYAETDAPNPLGVYGHSKLAGEQAIAEETDQHVILRTSWLYSADGVNFVKTMLQLASQRDEIGVVDDQRGCPTFAFDLAAAIVTIGESLARSAPPSRLYHLAGLGEITWCRFARAIMTDSAARGGPACRVRAIASAEYPTRARRPANSALDCSKAARDFGVRLPAWERSLERCLDQLLPALQGSAP
jgi:dTDP-4-dehydrorhamnose reductase